MDLRWSCGIPRVQRVAASDDPFGEIQAALREARDIQVEVARGEGREVFRTEQKETRGGTEASTVLGVEGMGELFL